MIGISHASPPVPGMDVRSTVFGGAAQYDVQTGEAQIGGSAFGARSSISSRGESTLVAGLSASTIFGLEPVAAATYNIRYRPGVLGNWLYDRYWQPRHDAQLQRILQNYDIEAARQQSWQEFLARVRGSQGLNAMGQQPSKPK
jgi:hypothetical protein